MTAAESVEQLDLVHRRYDTCIACDTLEVVDRSKLASTARSV
jgi:hypothetical protein